MMLAIIGRIGTAGGTRLHIEFGGRAIRALSMEGRMTVCNMAIEGRARAGLVAADDKTTESPGPPGPPTGAEWDALPHAYWKTLHSDDDARDSGPWSSSTASQIQPQVTWGTSPRWCCP